MTSKIYDFAEIWGNLLNLNLKIQYFGPTTS